MITWDGAPIEIAKLAFPAYFQKCNFEIVIFDFEIRVVSKVEPNRIVL